MEWDFSRLPFLIFYARLVFDLVLTVHSAKHLPVMDRSRIPGVTNGIDPYVRVRFGGRTLAKTRVRTQKGNFDLDPIWNEELWIPIVVRSIIIRALTSIIRALTSSLTTTSFKILTHSKYKDPLEIQVIKLALYIHEHRYPR